MKTKLIAVAVIAVVALTNLNANAQDAHQHTQQQQVTPRVQIQVQPPQQQIIQTPKIGVQVIQSHGVVEITSVSYNTPAQRLGLEAGDRILQINGHKVNSIADMQRWLRDAVDFHNGQIRLLVDNVRARHGQHVQRYVSVSTYLDGYAQHNPMPQPIPVYSAQQ